MHEPKNQANQSPSCVLCGAELASRDADRGTCHTCRDPSGKLLDLHVAILAALDDPMRIQEWPKIESRLRDRFGRGLDTAELWRQALGWIEDRLALEEKYRAHLAHRHHLVAEGDSPEARVKHLLDQWPW